MKLQAFNARCPLEVGDKVIIREEEKGMTAYYTPENLKIPAELLGSGVECIITDIAVIHFFREGKIQFQYELNNSGIYEPLIVKMPVKFLSDELKRRGR